MNSYDSEKIWKDGNIFLMSTGDVRVLWKNRLIDANGYIPISNFGADLINNDSTVKERIVKVYSINPYCGYLREMLDYTHSDLLWERSSNIYTLSELKEKLGVPQNEELVIIRKLGEIG